MDAAPPVDALEVMSCPGCGQQVRFPGNLGKLDVRCPMCDEEWRWPPPKQHIDVKWKIMAAWVLGVIFVVRMIQMAFGMLG